MSIAEVTAHGDRAGVVMQRTLQRAVVCEGTGLHSGISCRVTVLPAPPNTGIQFLPLLVSEDANPFRRALALAKEYSASGVLPSQTYKASHLLAALYGLGIDNAYVTLEGSEIPQVDGSAAPYVHLLQTAGISLTDVPRQHLRLKKTVEVAADGKSISARPAKDLRLSYSIDFPHPVIGRQSINLVLSEETFATHLAPARTFGFGAELALLREKGLARGASSESVLVLDDEGVRENELRFADEFVRHKVLDLVGDLALMGIRLQGHVVAHRAGAQLHAALCSRILGDPSAWALGEGEAPQSAPLPRPPTSVHVVSVSAEMLRILRDDISQIHSLSPDQFELFVCDRLCRMGFEVERVGSVYTPDGGVDVVAWPKEATFPFLLAVQAKHHRSANRKTGPGAVKELQATIEHGPFQAGLLVTSTTFTPSARWFASNRPQLVRLRDIHDLSRWLQDRFLDDAEWREIPARIELAPGVFVELPRGASLYPRKRES